MRFGHPTLIDETGYPSYNKPASVMFWLEAVRPTEEFVALLDTDMLLRAPLDARALGARRGVVVSAEYSYLVGTTTALAERFLDAAQRPLAAQCGGFHIFHRDDIAAIAPLWIEYTRRARAFAHADQEQYLRESFRDWAAASATLDAGERAVRRKQAMWQAEMYGYAFGAAVAGVSHVVRRDTMLYPGYVPHAGILPEILHYGSDFAVEPGPAGGGERLYFNKMTLVDLDLYACADGARGGGRDGDTGAAASASQPPPPATPPARPARRATCCPLDGRAQRRLLRLYRALRHRRRHARSRRRTRARRAAPPLRRHERRVRRVCAAGRVRLQPGVDARRVRALVHACRPRPPPRRRGPRPRPRVRPARPLSRRRRRRLRAPRPPRHRQAAARGCRRAQLRPALLLFGVRLRYGAALPQPDAGECADAAAAPRRPALPHRLSSVVGLAEFGARPLPPASGPLRLGGRGCDARGDGGCAAGSCSSSAAAARSRGRRGARRRRARWRRSCTTAARPTRWSPSR